MDELRTDTEKSENSNTFANLSNRAREGSDLLNEVTSQGAGETDQLQAQLIAIRNWAANQGEVRRTFFDSIGSNNAALMDLNADTRSARHNLATQSLSDREQAYAAYQNQRADAATQLGNIQSNPYSDSFKAGGKAAWDQMAKAASSAGYVNPGVSAAVKDWQGNAPRAARMNGDQLLPGISTQKVKRPEGSTIRSWDPEPEKSSTKTKLKAW